MNRSLDLLRFGGDTDTGLVREQNEDRLLLLPDFGVFAVIDGMGGESAGEKAAEIAVAVLKANFLTAKRDTRGPDLIRQVHLAIVDANNQIHEMAEANEEWSGMACVLTVAVVRDNTVTVGHVGDSRLYKLNRGTIEKLTKDHSPVGEREDAKELTEIQAMRDSRRNEVFRDVGSQHHHEDDDDFADVFQTSLEPESALLLCSDGLTDMVTSSEIHKIIVSNAGDPVQASRELIRIANEAGGRDNVTAIVIEGPRFETSARMLEPVPIAQDTGHSLAKILRPLASRPAMFLYGAVAGISLFFYLQMTSLGPKSPALPGEQHRTLRVSSASASGSFSTISDALVAAKEGDRVEVEPGEYRESVVLPNGVTLASTVPQGATIRPNRSENGETAGIVGQGVQASVIGFRILPGDGGLAFGVRLKDSSVDLTNLEIGSASVAGIQLDGNTSGLIRGNNIEPGEGIALVVGGANNVRVELNRFAGSTNSRPTVDIAEGASVQIIKNVIQGSVPMPIRGPAAIVADIIRSNHLFLEKTRRSSSTRPPRE